ncbi:hypothetical protein TVAG_491280 [Trichomonas vaginalis G3]|uniref:Trafficking protein particle complex subunit n=1 Tax=Trichomonas vaginalis (strain ATCC PRA-98 / G3) TaxID=412133 RepID=A2E070_TRIV3|nr:hypothetical protein TVAGG3_0219500 [Trichomonas vaginalis G3]EAY13989.1 hypothetical protein TVAG_491280 [Trichomonas vaginalis G3]KAI5551814.1 hypothetical protein TVAGG3_0219500 [Trichomonas vaginalis G3]|eukprot:XP_001326212.1 hypothetical protein [Trichomonas vaginalis G3]
MESASNNLTFLIVSEAIRDLLKRFDGMNDRDLQIETRIFELGRKPGFAFASFICIDDISVNTETEAAKFLVIAVAAKILGTKGIIEVKDGQISITFKVIPQQLRCLTSADGLFSPEQLFWYRCYANFIAGVFSGVLTHFGYKVFASFEPPSITELKFNFQVEKLEGNWTFFSVKQH